MLAYRDRATGRTAPNPDARRAMAEAGLDPKVEFAGAQPSSAQIHQLHHQAHDAGVIAHGVLTQVRIKPSA